MTPKIEEHAKMTAAGATRKRHKGTSVVRFRLFRFWALPDVILGAPGCPRAPDSAVSGAPDPHESMCIVCFWDIFAFSPNFRIFTKNRGKKHCARTALGPKLVPGPLSRKSRALPRDPKIGKKKPREPFGSQNGCVENLEHL